MFTGQLPDMGPFVIRYPRGKGTIVDWHQPMTALEIGKGECLKEGKDLAVITIGTMSKPTQKAIEQIESSYNATVAHYDIRFLKPMDQDLLHEISRKFKQIITIEDGVIQGGFGSAVLEFMSDNNYSVQVKRLGIPDSFIEHGTPDELYAMLGLDVDGITRSIDECLKGLKILKVEKLEV
jgi:1-deoxy-D-xylulose-5-phosphate synthase